MVTATVDATVPVVATPRLFVKLAVLVVVTLQVPALTPVIVIVPSAFTAAVAIAELSDTTVVPENVAATGALVTLSINDKVPTESWFAEISKDMMIKVDLFIDIVKAR